ncbi:MULTISPECIES: hypothetical protein [Streptomyces]|uniref:hypothetical protein n=1 Tax=Streptomyces TaxID=1883 RepID=UPI001928D229|nr:MULTISPECIES: hypothetical protein [Streptomyces]
MRPRSLSGRKSVLVAVLGCAVLSVGGVRSAVASDNDPEARFRVLATAITQSCGPVRVDRVTASVSPSKAASAAAAAAASASRSASWSASRSTSVPEVPLGVVEACAARVHVQRVDDAFESTGTSGYRAMRDKLTELGYPASRIHRMPDVFSDTPRARLDLRVDGGHLALDVTDYGANVVVEAFGAPASTGVSVTDVRRTPIVDRPTS